MSRNGKVLVAMSGGVDSSVAVGLLREQGYECVGVFMRVGAHEEPTEEEGTKGSRGPGTKASRNQGTEGQGASEASGPGARPSALNTPSAVLSPQHSVRNIASPTPETDHSTPARRLRHGCCSVSDALDARAVAARLGIPFYVLNFEQDFDRIIDYFIDEYAQARTPNPCVLCNMELKFGRLLRYADMLDADFVATGHYARILRAPLLCEQCAAEPTSGAPTTADTAVAHNDGCRAPYLARAVNLAKDQSYVLFGIRRQDLPRCLFPIGEIADKATVRRIAADLGLRVHDKPDSQEICFVPNDDYKQLVRARRPETQRPGQVRDAAGNVLGTHGGIVNYTIGQRHGLGIALRTPMYVTKLDVLNNTVTLGPREDLLSTGLIAERVNWLVDPPRSGETRPAAIKIRHTHTPAPGSICVLPDGGVKATFAKPQTAVTPGQAAVFYDGDAVLGGGWIVRGIHHAE